MHDYGAVGSGGAYLIMELVAGRTWRAELQRSGVIAPARASEWFRQLLDGLQFAHAMGIVHRDLKPENVMIVSPKRREPPGGGDALKIMDFGLAKVLDAGTGVTESVTMAGTAMGTLGYMAPEVLTGGLVDERADIFAIGVMVVETLTGVRPFGGQTQQEILTGAAAERVSLAGRVGRDQGARRDHATVSGQGSTRSLRLCPGIGEGTGSSDRALGRVRYSGRFAVTRRADRRIVREDTASMMAPAYVRSMTGVRFCRLGGDRMNDRFAEFRNATAEALLDGPGTTAVGLRQSIAAGRPPAELTALVEKIRSRAYTVTDQDLDALRGRYTDDELFEVVVAAAFGKARDQLAAAHRALEDA